MKKLIALTTALILLVSAVVIPTAAYKSYHAAVVDSGKITDGMLIYRETFDYADTPYPEGAADETMTANKPLMDLLGWTVLNTADGALNDNSVGFSIKDGKLVCDNTINGANGTKDSYCLILSDEEMWEVASYGKYTLQYDLEYLEDTTDAKDRYVVPILNFNGSDTYNSFHLRTRGNGNNQCRVNGEWKTYDKKDANDYAANGTDDGTLTSPVFKITNGATSYAANVSALIDGHINMTIRYQVDFNNYGPTIYIRNNNIENSDFVLVSKCEDSSSDGALYWQNMIYMPNYAFGFKTSPKVKATIDNMYLYTGLGDVPADTNVSYTPSVKPEESTIRNADKKYGGISFVGCQSAVGENGMAVRFIGGIDSKKYDKVGFKISMSVNGEVTDKSIENKDIYLRIKEKNGDANEDFYASLEARQDYATYMTAGIVENVPKTGTVVFEVTPYNVSFDGVTHEADTYIVTFTDGVLVSQSYK